MDKVTEMAKGMVTLQVENGKLRIERDKLRAEISEPLGCPCRADALPHLDDAKAFQPTLRCRIGCRSRVVAQDFQASKCVMCWGGRRSARLNSSPIV